jgi:hypothetical protein
MEHYSLALSLDPKNEGALNGLHRMEAGSEAGLEASYDMEMAETTGTFSFNCDCIVMLILIENFILQSCIL